MLAETEPRTQVSEMSFELGMVVVVEAFDRRVLNGAVHPLNLDV